MRSDLRKRLEKLEEIDQRNFAPVDIDFGPCLSAEEWQTVLSQFDADPHVAFAAITSDAVPACVVIVGDKDGPAPVPKSFTDLIECEDPRAHFWTARMAAWALVYRTEGFWTDAEPWGFPEAISRLLTRSDPSDRLTALYEALKASDAATEARPIVFDLIGVERRSPVGIELIGADARL